MAEYEYQAPGKSRVRAIHPVALSIEAGLKVGVESPHVEPGNQCQRSSSKEEWVKVSFWEDDLG